jgi:outer membrane protein OmpA-like peptidoglycan-associated protein
MFQRIIVSCLVIFLVITSFAQEKTIHLEKTKFSSGFDDFGVRIFQDKIYVISTARDSVPVYDEKTGKPFTDIFVVQNELLVPAQFLSEKYGKELFISSHFYDGPITSNKDETLVFFSNNSDPALGDKMGIFYLKKNKSGAWSESIPFPFNSAAYSTMHPFYDEPNRLLYFAANKPNGVGRFDIYSVPFDGEQFGEMQLIEVVNSSMNDTYPFVIGNELYFSSDRVEGLGGLDIYKMTQDKIITNVGGVFNTTFDDFDLTLIDENNGFFASNRQKTIATATDDDCYFFHYAQPIDQFVYTETSLEDSLKNEELLKLSNELLLASKNNVYFNSANALISNTLQETKNNNLEINRLEKALSEKLSFIYSESDSLLFKNKTALTKRIVAEKSAKRILNKIAKSSDPKIRALLLDSLAINELFVGNSDEVNPSITQAIIINQEISDRFDKSKTNKESLDNATQIILVEVSKSNIKSDNSLLKDQLLAYQDKHDITIATQQTHTFNNTTVQSISDTYVSDPILFAFDSYELSQEYDTMLIEMAVFIQSNNAFQIFVDGHTDDSGKLAYNSKLSKKRALAVKRFLIKQGVKPTDFVVAYYGPEKPVATNDTREGRKLNRRVEIRLVPRK